MKEGLNLVCPYKVYKEAEHHSYYFTTKNGIEYAVAFQGASDYFGDIEENNQHIVSKIYSITLEKISTVTAPLDLDTGQTMQAIVNDFFNDRENALVYICDMKDNKQNQRQKIFNRWYKNSASTNNIRKIENSLLSTFHIALLYHLENPHQNTVIQIYTQYIQELDNK